MVKKVLYSILGIMVIAVVMVAGLFAYVKTQQEEVSEKIKSIANERLNGELEFDEIKVNLFKTFPSFSFELSNLSLSAPDSLSKKAKLVELDKVYVKINFWQLLQNNVQFQGLKLSNGLVHIFKDSNSISTTDVFKTQAQSEESSEDNNGLYQFDDKMSIEINHLRMVFEYAEKNSKISYEILKLMGHGKKNEDGHIVFHAHLSAHVDSMGFRLEQGTFFDDTEVDGHIKGTWDGKRIVIPPFQLRVGSQYFTTDCVFGTENDIEYCINFTNDKVAWEPSYKMMSQEVKDILSPLEIMGHIKTKANLEGVIAPNRKPLLTVHFEVEDNVAKLIDNLVVNHFRFKGYYVNRVDPGILLCPGASLVYDYGEGEIEKIRLSSQHGRVSTARREAGKVDLEVRVDGNAKGFNKILGNTDFFFTDGKVEGKLRVNAFIDHLKKEIWNHFYGVFSISNNKIYFKPVDLNVFINEINFEIDHSLLTLNKMEVVLNKDVVIHVEGNIRNFEPLIFEGSRKPNEAVQTAIAVKAGHLSWEDIKEYFAQDANDNGSQEKQIRKIKDALSTINRKFRPAIKVDIEDFQFYALSAQKLSSESVYEGVDKLHFKNTGFTFADGTVHLDASFDWSRPGKTDIITQFKAKNFKAGRFAEAFGFFGIDALKNAKLIKGILDVDAQLALSSDDKTSLEKTSLNGKVDYQLTDLELIDFEPIAKMGKLIFRKERVENFKIKKLKNTMTFEDLKMIFPNTMVESTSLNFTFEGTLDYRRNSRLFMTFPLANLKYRKLNEIPKIDTTNSNLYVYAVEDTFGNMKYFLNLKDRRGDEEFQEKISKKIERSERKALRDLK